MSSSPATTTLTCSVAPDVAYTCLVIAAWASVGTAAVTWIPRRARPAPWTPAIPAIPSTGPSSIVVTSYSSAQRSMSW